MELFSVIFHSVLQAWISMKVEIDLGVDKIHKNFSRRQDNKQKSLTILKFPCPRFLDKNTFEIS
jgi:hypothetical protein